MTKLLPSAASSSYDDDVFTGTSPEVQRLRMQVERIAPHFRVALLTGESGVGKRAIAQKMHRASPAARHPFTVMESSEFARNGRLPAAHGTVYLHGLDALHPASQGKMLRAIKALHRETRVVVASQHDLRSLVSAGRLRHDLYESVGTLEIRVPPLRNRLEDLTLIILSMLKRLSVPETPAEITPGALVELAQHQWPGNLEELFATCEALSRTRTLIAQPQLPLFEGHIPASPPARLEEAMHRHVLDVLQSCSGNKLRAAEALGISRSTLYRMLDTQSSNAI